jgi:hypothetical protein
MAISTSTFTSVPIESGLDFILSHLEEPHFPRRISAYTTDKKQILVYSKGEALARFKQSNLLDCRISAYPYPVPECRGINAQVPNFFLTDLDRKDFKTDKLFKQSLQNTLQNFKDRLHGSNPTVLWSGGGYHLLQPLDADIILEMESIFAEFDEPSRKLMPYAENLMTDGKADSVHRGTVAFGNCMIRLPGSYNAKYVEFDDKGQVVNIAPQSEVKIVQLWNGYRPSIRWLLKDYWIYLIQERNNEALKGIRNEQKRLRFERRYPNHTNDRETSRIGWIESLYAKPLDDFRKYCIWRIFTPYFLNVRRLSRSDVFNLIVNWLDRCSSECKRLDFRPRQKINDSLDSVKKYRPVSKERLKIENEPLYLRLKTEGVLVGDGCLN